MAPSCTHQPEEFKHLQLPAPRAPARHAVSVNMLDARHAHTVRAHLYQVHTKPTAASCMHVMLWQAVCSQQHIRVMVMLRH